MFSEQPKDSGPKGLSTILSLLRKIYFSPLQNLPQFSTVETQYILNFPGAASDQTAALRIRRLFRELPQCPVVENPPSNAGGLVSNELGIGVLHRKEKKRHFYLKISKR